MLRPATEIQRGDIIMVIRRHPATHRIALRVTAVAQITDPDEMLVHGWAGVPSLVTVTCVQHEPAEPAVVQTFIYTASSLVEVLR